MIKMESLELNSHSESSTVGVNKMKIEFAENGLAHSNSEFDFNQSDGRRETVNEGNPDLSGVDNNINKMEDKIMNTSSQLSEKNEKVASIPVEKEKDEPLNGSQLHTAAENMNFIPAGQVNDFKQNLQVFSAILEVNNTLMDTKAASRSDSVQSFEASISCPNTENENRSIRKDSVSGAATSENCNVRLRAKWFEEQQKTLCEKELQTPTAKTVNFNGFFDEKRLSQSCPQDLDNIQLTTVPESKSKFLNGSDVFDLRRSIEIGVSLKQEEMSETMLESSVRPKDHLKLNEFGDFFPLSKLDTEENELSQETSLKDVEQCFISALNMASSDTDDTLKEKRIIKEHLENEVPCVATTVVPKVKQEVLDSGCTEDSDNQTGVSTEIYRDINSGIQIDTVPQANIGLVTEKFDVEAIDCSSTAVNAEEHEGTKSNAGEGHKAVFYISSSELPSSLSNKKYDGLRHRNCGNATESCGAQQRAKPVRYFRIIIF